MKYWTLIKNALKMSLSRSGLFLDGVTCIRSIFTMISKLGSQNQYQYQYQPLLSGLRPFQTSLSSALYLLVKSIEDG
uniref:Uncharacterized protein n=1 Tax=Glossina brevipalpis TaxID=37001 RepID=A0A1A9W3V8_9MUSC